MLISILLSAVEIKIKIQKHVRPVSAETHCSDAECRLFVRAFAVFAANFSVTPSFISVDLEIQWRYARFISFTRDCVGDVLVAVYGDAEADPSAARDCLVTKLR